MSQGDSVKVEKIVWDQGLEEEMESAGSEHTSHLSSKNLEPNQTHGPPNKTAPLLSTQHTGDLEGLFWSGDPSLALLPLPAF